MTQMNKTIVFVVAAVVLAGLAYLLAPSRVTPDAFLDQGEKFYPDFTDPNEATSLEVIRFDEASGAAVPFKVTFANGIWTIPSHNDYPADAKDRLAQTAAGIIDLTKDDFRTANVSDHARCGVLDPLDQTAPGIAGRGTRVTVRGEGDKLLADFIVGDTVSGQSGYRFVRIPGQNRVYAAKADMDISTRFSDWIETNLLQVVKADVDELDFNNYTINEKTGSLVKGEAYTLSRKDSKWSMHPTRSGRELDSAAVNTLLQSIEGLTIEGVRPKPEGLKEILTTMKSTGSLNMNDRMSLQNKGFYITNQGGIVSNDGELKVHSTRGVIYTLRFGEILYGTGLEVSAGSEDETSQGGKNGGQENRYLMVTANFDQKAFGRKPSVADSSFLSKADSLYTDADKEHKKQYDAFKKWEAEVAEGRAFVDSLNERFADWYYVISGEAFDKIHLGRDALYVKEAS